MPRTSWTRMVTDNRFRLLLIDASDGEAQAFEEALSTLSIPPYEFTRKPTYRTAQAALEEQEWDVIVIDPKLPDGPPPVELLGVIQRTTPEVPIIVFNGLEDEPLANCLINQGAHASLTKGLLDQDALHPVIQSALKTKHLQAQLLQRSSDLRQLVQTIEEGIVVTGPDARIRYTNAAAASLLGAATEALLGTRIPLRAPLTRGRYSDIDLAQGNGTKTLVDVKVTPIQWQGDSCFLISLHDISDRTKREAERISSERTSLHQEKIESLGLFADKITHDFNNFLAGIMGHSEVLGLELPETATAARSLELIKQSSRNAASLCEQLQACAGKGAFTPSPHELNQLIRDHTSSIQSSATGNIRLVFELDDSIPTVMADADQLAEIMMNLVINAEEAIEAQQGTITIRTCRIPSSQIELRYAITAPKSPKDSYACLQVQDTGCGMTPEILNRIFEPFYSTKEGSQGLGLSKVHGVVQGHRGILTVDSIPEQGTTVSIYLEETSAPPTKTEGPLDSSDQLPQHVLVVDDQRHVREVATRMLEHLGCRVSIARSGSEALTMINDSPDSYRIVLLDLSMPIQSGPSTLRKIRDLDPNIKVIMMSGFEVSYTSELLGELKPDGYLRKPFEMETLSNQLRSLASNRR